MSRADDLQAAYDNIPYGEPVVASVGVCLRAIPDLLAVVRAAQQVRGNDPSVGTLRRALAAIEAGGKERE